MTEQVANAEPAAVEVAGGQTAPETATTTTQTSPTLSPEELLDQQLSEVYDKTMLSGAERDAAKTAAAKALVTPKQEEDPDLKALTVSTDEPAKAEGEPALSPAIAPPNSASAEIKAIWATLPPKAQEFIAQREKDAHAKISEQGNELATYKPLHEVFDYLRHQGVPQGRETEVVRNWAAAQSYLDRDPIAGVKWLAESYGVDLAQLVGSRPQQANQQTPEGLDALFRDDRLDKEILPVVQQLKGELAQVKSQVSARAIAEYQQRESNAKEIITKFAADKPYWSDVEQDVTREVAILKQANPRTPMDQLIQEGYERATWANKGVRDRMLADQKAEADAKAETARKAAEAEKAAKASKAKTMAAINQRTGTSASTPIANGKWDDDAAMGAIYDRIQAGSR